jgi:hypothetical protein
MSGLINHPIFNLLSLYPVYFLFELIAFLMNLVRMPDTLFPFFNKEQLNSLNLEVIFVHFHLRINVAYSLFNFYKGDELALWSLSFKINNFNQDAFDYLLILFLKYFINPHIILS